MIQEIKECYADYDIHDEVVIHYSITLNCNLKCKYCIRIAKEESESDILEFLSELDKFYELNKRKIILRISGGEPLISKNFSNLLLESSKKNYITEIEVFTNGTLLNDSIVKLINIVNLTKPIKLYNTIHISQLYFDKINEIISQVNKLKCKIVKLFIVDYKTALSSEEAIKILLKSNYEYMFNTNDIEDSRKTMDLLCIPELNYPLKVNGVDSTEFDVYDFNKFNFNNFICNAGYDFVFYINKKIYRCTSFVESKKSIDCKLSNYKISKITCPHKKCICERSIYKCNKN